MAVLGADAQSFSDTTVATNRRYSYRVYAYNGVGGSYTSNVVSAIAPGGSTMRGPAVSGGSDSAPGMMMRPDGAGFLEGSCMGRPGGPCAASREPHTLAARLPESQASG